jgi:hypothetical protein
MRTTVPPHTRGAGEGDPTHAPGAENLRRAIAGVAPREEADDEHSQDGLQGPEHALRDQRTRKG